MRHSELAETDHRLARGGWIRNGGPASLRWAFSFGALLLFSGGSCSVPESDREPLVVLIALDGATPRILNELRAANKLPNIDRLIRSGSYGPNRALASRRILDESRRATFASPILWTSIATGQVPERHGVRDFILPIEGTTSVWMGSESDPAVAEIELPEIRGRGLSLELTMRTRAATSDQWVELRLNDTPLEPVQLSARWKRLEVALPRDSLSPALNRLRMTFSRQSRPSGSDTRRLAAELRVLRVLDANGEPVIEVDPVYDRERFGGAVYPPTAKATEVQSTHWRSRPLWSYLGDAGYPIGVIGWWGSWPASRVNGFLVSSRMGIAEQREGSDALTWPPPLAETLRRNIPDSDAIEGVFRTVGSHHCDPGFVDRHSVLSKILVQDETYGRFARELLPAMDRGLFTVYLRSIDVASHVALHLRAGEALPPGCAEPVRDLVDRVYERTDAFVGELVSIAGDRATFILVSDHGLTAGQSSGVHTRDGIWIAKGPGLRRGVSLRGASILDVAPTILAVFGEPIPLDMDGAVLAQAFEPTWLEEHAPRYADIDTRWRHLPESEVPREPVDERLLEDLRTLGYLP